MTTRHPLAALPRLLVLAACAALAMAACGRVRPADPITTPTDTATAESTATATSDLATDTTTATGTSTRTESDATDEETATETATECMDYDEIAPSAGIPLTPDPRRCDLDDGYWTKVAATAQPDAEGCHAACVGTAQLLEGQVHVREKNCPVRVSYGRFPPTSGYHWGCWEKWGVATREVPPERFVHNLEHAAIVLLYRCPRPPEGFADDAFTGGTHPCPTEAAAAQALIDPALNPTLPLDDEGFRRYLVAPSSRLTTRFAALAWGWSLEQDVLTQEEFNCFAAAHMSQGPENLLMDGCE